MEVTLDDICFYNTFFFFSKAAGKMEEKISLYFGTSKTFLFVGSETPELILQATAKGNIHFKNVIGHYRKRMCFKELIHWVEY